MAVSPRPRSRRATNVECELAVPVYETEARKFIRANKIKNSAAKVEKVAKLECHKAMLAADIASYSLEEDGKTYDCIIAGGTESEISIEKLYAMIASGDITMAQFLKCCSATQTKVKAELGSNVLAKVLVTTPTEANLSISERK